MVSVGGADDLVRNCRRTWSATPGSLRSTEHAFHVFRKTLFLKCSVFDMICISQEPADQVPFCGPGRLRLRGLAGRPAQVHPSPHPRLALAPQPQSAPTPPRTGGTKAEGSGGGPYVKGTKVKRRESSGAVTGYFDVW